VKFGNAQFGGGVLILRPMKRLWLLLTLLCLSRLTPAAEELLPRPPEL